MSAFLGPIHFILYNKIQNLVRLTDNLLYIFGPDSSSELSGSLKKSCGENETRALEEVVDKSAIHNWLNNQVNIAESRLAYVVHEALKRDEALYKKIEDEFYKDGEQEGINQAEVITAEGLFNAINMYLLDGMPCDGGIIIQNNDSSDIMWDVNLSVHKPFYDKEGISADYYFNLRDKWLEGFFSSHKTVEYIRLGVNTFRISEI